MSKPKITEEQAKEQIKEQYFIHNMLYSEEEANYTEDEEEIKRRIEVIKNDINNDFNEDDLLTSKEALLNHDYFLNLIAHFIKGEYDPVNFDEDRLNELIEAYDKINTCFNNDGLDKTLEIIEEYGKVIPKDANGFYQLNDTIVNKVIDDNDFYITNKEIKEDIEKEIFNTWENQKEILTQDSLNKYSEARNGINFKHFIFCEEYLKRGKIKPTCEYLGISRNTAYTWLKDDKVQAYLKSRQDEIKGETDSLFINTYRECFNELNDLITGHYTDNTDKIKAIDVFLRHYANMERIKQPSTTYED